MTVLAIGKAAPWHALASRKKWTSLDASVVLTIDPALRSAGVAVWALRPTTVELLGAYDVTNAGDPYSMALFIHQMAGQVIHSDVRQVFAIVEKMQHYRGKAARDTSLEAVEAVTKALANWYPRIADPWLPAQWKGQVPKDVHHGRLRRVLWPRWDGLGPDALDAIVICLFAFGVVGRGGVSR